MESHICTLNYCTITSTSTSTSAVYLSLAAMIINHHTTKPKELRTIILIMSTTYIASGEPYIDNKFPLVEGTYKTVTCHPENLSDVVTYLYTSCCSSAMNENWQEIIGDNIKVVVVSSFKSCGENTLLLYIPSSFLGESTT